MATQALVCYITVYITFATFACYNGHCVCVNVFVCMYGVCACMCACMCMCVCVHLCICAEEGKNDLGIIFFSPICFILAATA